MKIKAYNRLKALRDIESDTCFIVLIRIFALNGMKKFPIPSTEGLLH